MTVLTDRAAPPPETPEAEALFPEAKRRERRRRLVVGLLMLAIVGVLVGVLSSFGNAPLPKSGTAAGHTNARGAIGADTARASNGGALSLPAGSELFGVMCRSASTCIAVGEVARGFFPDVEAASTKALVVDFHSVGRNLGAGVTAAPPLLSIATASCPLATRCVAIGETRQTAGLEVPAWTTFDGRSWSTPRILSLGDATTRIDSVSCVSPTFCIAVGYRRDPTGTALAFAAQFDGHGWTPMQTPSGASDYTASNELMSVSCVSDRACTAVGYYYDHAHGYSLSEHFDGRSWRTLATPSPGRKTTMLNGVSCTGSDCVAVGYFDSDHVLVLHERGEGWSLMATPSPGVDGGSLNAVTCSSSGCVAVRAAVAGRMNRPLIEELRDDIWSVDGVPGVGKGQTAFLTAVSCGSSSNCLAIGQSSSRTSGPAADATIPGPIIEHLVQDRWLLARG